VAHAGRLDVQGPVGVQAVLLGKADDRATITVPRDRDLHVVARPGLGVDLVAQLVRERRQIRRERL
jgi:hypothetical protein